MDTVIRYVRDIELGQRLWLEAEIGRQLQDDQRVVIEVLGPGDVPREEARRAAFERLAELSQQGARNRETLGVSEDEGDAVLDEAIGRVRRRR